MGAGEWLRVWVLICGMLAAGVGAHAQIAGERIGVAAYATDRLNRLARPGAIVVQNVRTGALVAVASTTADPARPEEHVGVTSRVLPLSLTKLLAAALWWDHTDKDSAFSCQGSGPNTTIHQSLVDGCDGAVAEMSIALRHTVGSDAVLRRLAAFGFGNGSGAAPESQILLSAKMDDATWGRTFAIGEDDVTVTPLHVSRILQAIGNDGVMVPGGRVMSSAAVIGLANSPADTQLTSVQATDSCFALYDFGSGKTESEGALCNARVTPASTFKIAHALAALDAGVVTGPQEQMPYDGSGDWPETAQRDHTLASAIRYSVVWYFQRVAERLGPQRERDYLHRLKYGNEDPSSGLTTFWIGGSLQISPMEQVAFLRRLYLDSLPVSKRAAADVREMLVQPQNVVTNAAGEHPFDNPWPKGTVLSAKTGASDDRDGRRVLWIVGHIRRGRRTYVFVSCVAGPAGTSPDAAMNLAAERLRRRHLL